MRDICFNNTGSQFLSAAYDRYLKLWDSETGESHHLNLICISCEVLWSPDVPLGVFVSAGKCISHFTNRKVPYCVKFNPDEDKQNLFVAGMSDKKIVQVKYVGFNHVCVNPFSAAAWNQSESHFQHGCG